MPVIVIPLVFVLLVVVMIPISIVQRFRTGTARRQARGWVAMLNLVSLVFSIAIVLAGSFVTSQWVPEALTYTVAGLAAGGVLGLLGIALTHWEVSGGLLHYTPNRWLVLGITVVVATRVLYGLWRTWDTLRTSLETMTLVAASGLATSMSAGAVALGYYVVYWAGVRRGIRRFRRGIPSGT